MRKHSWNFQPALHADNVTEVSKIISTICAVINNLKMNNLLTDHYFWTLYLTKEPE